MRLFILTDDKSRMEWNLSHEKHLFTAGEGGYMEEGEIRWIMEEIRRAIIGGISVRVDGICGIESIETLQGVQEEITYMEDYIGDDNGRIIEISFSRVKIPKPPKYSNQ